MQTVSFVRMADGTKEDYELLERYEVGFCAALPGRLLRALDQLKESLPGYKVSRYEHSLQSASRARRDGKDDEYVVGALFHDLGDELAPHTHGEMVAAILKPFVRPEVWWIVQHHGAFQMYYYAHHRGLDRNVRDRWADSEHYDACVEFCELYDQNCFDPSYESLPVEEFEPLVNAVFSEPRYLDRSVAS